MRPCCLLLWSFTFVVSLSSKFEEVKAKTDELKQILLELKHEIDEESVRLWLKETNEELRITGNKQALATWNFETNVNDKTSAERVKVMIDTSKIMKEKALEARIKMTNTKLSLSKNTIRTLRIMSQYTDPHDTETLEKLEKTKSDLENIYAKATLEKDGKIFNMEPELTQLMSNERDPDLLSWAWKGWRDATGRKMISLYGNLTDLLNKGAEENGYRDAGEGWRSILFDDTPELQNMCEELWDSVLPLYKKLHAYVRMKLRNYYAEKYPAFEFPDDGTIPANLLGNMWAQEWQGIYDIIKPFPEIEESDITDEMNRQHYTVEKLFKTAEEFYSSLGLDRMTDTFWDKSMIVRPDDRDVQCHASASDFYTAEKHKNKDDFRIKMCTEINADYFETIHHEMGHIQYFMEYRDQPFVFRNGANAAFHEAIGDTISLSVLSQKHLKTIGLLPRNSKQDKDEKKQNINILMKRALFKVAFLPFGYLVDLWRWKAFDGSISKSNFNREWWKYRLKYQGLSPPVKRSDEDFDPGAKYHIPANSMYIGYFISFISQFQFYKSLCEESGHTGELHTCDYYRSKEAGSKLKEFLKLGLSIPWRDATKVLTGSREISTDAIREYFRPLMDWLDTEIAAEKVGWNADVTNYFD